MSAEAPPPPEYIDHSVFLGMHAALAATRLRCKALLVARLRGTLLMTWEHVGHCDDIIWRHSRTLQDLYYPFMDALHSHRCLRREGYEDSTLRLATSDPRLLDLPVLQRLLAARALERQALVYTMDPVLLARPELPVQPPPACEREPEFPSWLEALYQSSLRLRIPLPAREAA
jgi:uncharacterized protein DUF6190